MVKDVSKKCGNTETSVLVASGFLTSEMCELEPRSESLNTSLLEGMEGKVG
jgi:hypothetical protein